jgi:hypothetical protein
LTPMLTTLSLCLPLYFIISLRPWLTKTMVFVVFFWKQRFSLAKSPPIP